MLATGISLWIALFALAQQPETVDLLKSDSRSPYVHRITLYDHDGKAIRPGDLPALPYSPRATCGKCHPYGEIRCGWHFNAGRPPPNVGRPPSAGNVGRPPSAGDVGRPPPAGHVTRTLEGDGPTFDDGRPGEPWFLVDAKTGAVTPISARGWPGTLMPADVGLSDWDMVKLFGRHMPGGGFGEPPANGDAASTSIGFPLRATNRTRLASGGPVGPALACGVLTALPGEGLAEGRGSRPRWQVSGPLEIDCMICHSADQQHDPAEAARQIEKENFRWAATAALGLGVVRGEARRAPDDWDPYMPPDPDFPERAGPTLIYDKTRFDPDDRVLFQITRRVPNERCYFCHSTRLVGPDAPEPWHTDQDVHIAAGLMCVDCHRHGIDHNMTRGYEGESQHPARVARTCRGCHLGDEGSAAIATVLGGHPKHAGLPPLHLEKLTCTACHSGPWPREHVQRVQTAMAHELGLATRQRQAELPPTIVGPVFARTSKEQPITPMRQLDDGRVGASYRWALAHDVRPAAQSLGVRGCEDCHSAGGPIFFGAVSLAGEGRMYELHGYDPVLAQLWALGFKTRPAFKWFAFVCVGVVALVLLRALLGMAPWQPPAALAALRRPALLVMLVGVAVEAVGGFGGEWLRDEVQGWTLLVHMLAAPLFIVGLTGVAALWPASCAGQRVSRWWKLTLWGVILAGFVVTVTMLAAMLPYFGYAVQETLTKAHAVAAWVLLAALAAWAAVGRLHRPFGPCHTR